MLKRIFLTLLPLALLIALPIVLRKSEEKIDLSADQLVIVTPNSEAIRYEFEQAFRKYYRAMTGRAVSIDWRAPGGTGDAVRYVNSSYAAAFKDYWTREKGQTWNTDVELAFANTKLKPEDNPARKAFLESDISIGIDLFFGGGQYDFQKQAAMGHLVAIGIQNPESDFYRGNPKGFLYTRLTVEQQNALYPPKTTTTIPKLYDELFGNNPQISQQAGGEIWYDKNDAYYGACFSSFGICQNTDVLKKAGFNCPDGDFPLKSWFDLADAKLFQKLGIADPTKSGSVNKCFEMIIQRAMAETVSKLSEKKLPEQDVLDTAWQDAMTLIKKIGGNASYITFSASKIPVDVARGQAAAGICIDFYGESQAEWEETHQGRRFMFYHTPLGESSVSMDPIGLFRGAPHPEIAKLFIRFVLSQEGQALWNQKIGTPNGPIKYNLHRQPVRRDCYEKEALQYSLSPNANPFIQASSFQYRGKWTGPYFSLIRELIRVMVLDCHEELQDAWQAIIEAGGPDCVPQAYECFSKLPFSHHEASQVSSSLYDMTQKTVLMRQWAQFFRDAYNQAKQLAINGK